MSFHHLGLFSRDGSVVSFTIRNSIPYLQQTRYQAYFCQLVVYITHLLVEESSFQEMKVVGRREGHLPATSFCFSTFQACADL